MAKKIKRELKQGEAVHFDMYADGCLETVHAEVVCDDGENVSVLYTHPLYPEAGKSLKVLQKRALTVEASK